MNDISAVSWQLTLTQPDKQKETGGNEGEGDLCILIFGSLVTPDKAVSLHFSHMKLLFSRFSSKW